VPAGALAGELSELGRLQIDDRRADRIERDDESARGYSERVSPYPSAARAVWCQLQAD